MKPARASRSRPLGRYEERRDFGVTAEPPARVRPTPSGRSFVVQKHAARRLHYDLRLELDGVLLSWAVPKGPSLSPKDRRLAVQTEDRPVDYRDFEGTIPKGEYGGGPVIVWDRGEWRPVGDPREGLARGRLEFDVEGEKLRGRYLLVRTRRAEGGGDGAKTSWLLIKRDDAHARDGAQADVVGRMPRSILTGRTIEDVAAGVPAAPRKASPPRRAASRARPGRRRVGAKLPAFGAIAPELATLVTDVPSRGDWVFELKYDGYRALASLDEGHVRIGTRGGKDWTDRFPEIADALSHVRARTALFDGEIAYVLEDGRTDFQHLQNALSTGDRARLVYFVFDLLFYDGVDLRGEPLTVRKDELRTILAGEGPPLRLGDHVEGDGAAFLSGACAMGLEGILAKRADAPYRSGRGKDWVKVKCDKRQEVVIVGYTPPKGSRTGLGALLLAVREPDGFRYVGKVGTGFTQASLAELSGRLSTMKVPRPPVKEPPRASDATWVRPELVCQVRFTEWTRDGVLRHPSFEGLREDKRPQQVTREVPGAPPGAPAADARPGARRRKGDEHEVLVDGVAVSHAARVLDPASGITKLDVVRYYEAAAEHLLPFAAKRPLMLVRCTDTIAAGVRPRRGGANRGACFVQKHAGRGLLEDLGRSEVLGEEVLFVTTPREILELGQQNALELHGWGCRMPRWDRPDWIVFDLDPDEGLHWARVVDAARELRDELARLSLESFVKTTGGKGLHVVVPLQPRHDWDTVRAFAEAVATGMTLRAPDAYVATMSKAKRRGKIFVDWLRNARGATAVLPYSPRARAGLTVAMPVPWSELGRIDPRELTVLTVPKRLARRRVDPWAELLASRQTLSRGILSKLG